MRFTLVQSVALAIVAGLACAASGAESPAADDAWQKHSEALSTATVTVRVWATSDVEEPESAKAAADKAPPGVTICSGVCVGKGQIVTSAIAGTDSKIRLTLAGGKQATGAVRVLDEHSGLMLLACEEGALTPLELAAAPPSAGASVMTAAAWGTEKPVVSLGIVGGVDRTLPGASYPPLLQCDLRTTETSSGAAVIDRSGKLVGVLVATDNPQARRGWAYAIPTVHVQRLLRAEAERKSKDSGVIILKRRRPVVGMVLEGEEDSIVVQRLTPGGPAEKAGLKLGDRVLATDGVSIRSVYQAVLPTLYKQPGDTMQFRVQRADGVHTFQVVLGGGVEVGSAPFDMLGNLIQPKLEIGRDPKGGYFARRPGGTTAEVFAPPLPPEPAEPPRVTSADKIALLEKAIERYQIVIEHQQQQLAQREEDRQKTEQLLQSLQSDLAKLRRQLEPARP